MHVDRDGDGAIAKGKDLVLQTTAREYAKYRADGGRETCVSCHMPGLGPGRAAETARVPDEQAKEAPPRALHDHGFVGVDAPLDGSPDTQAEARARLLHGAARLTIDYTAAYGGTVEVDVSLANVGAGHNLPTGFAFARQMWLEVVGRRANGELFDASGVVQSPTLDLCDPATMDAEPALRRFVLGCAGSDLRLVNFQQKLVDRVEVVTSGGAPVLDALGDPRLQKHPDGRETHLQHLTGGAVPRARGSDGQLLATLAPGESRKLSYTLRGEVAPGEAIEISARLLFRALPPYFLRALAAGQGATDARIDELPSRLSIVEMATARATARRQ